MDREKTLSRIRAVKVLNYALSGEEGRERCLRFVDVSGLKYLFPLFMGKVNRIYFRTQSIDHCLKKGNKKLKKSHSSAFNESEDEGRNRPSFMCVPNMIIEHITCIILSLLRNLRQEDVQRMRVILKFTEDDYEKVDRLIEMKDQYEKKDNQVKQELAEAQRSLSPEDYEEYEADFYIRRLNAGLFILQRVCLLIAVLSEESEGVREKAMMLLKRQDEDMLSVFKLIEEETALIADFVYLKNMAKSSHQ